LVVVAAEEAGALEALPFFFFTWCFLWLFFAVFAGVPAVSWAKTRLDVETVNNKANAITNAFFILASFKMVKK
jgi:hypothetical protein